MGTVQWRPRQKRGAERALGQERRPRRTKRCQSANKLLSLAVDRREDTRLAHSRRGATCPSFLRLQWNTKPGSEKRREQECWARMKRTLDVKSTRAKRLQRAKTGVPLLSEMNLASARSRGHSGVFFFRGSPQKRHQRQKVRDTQKASVQFQLQQSGHGRPPSTLMAAHGHTAFF